MSRILTNNDICQQQINGFRIWPYNTSHNAMFRSPPKLVCRDGLPWEIQQGSLVNTFSPMINKLDSFLQASSVLVKACNVCYPVLAGLNAHQIQTMLVLTRRTNLASLKYAIAQNLCWLTTLALSLVNTK